MKSIRTLVVGNGFGRNVVLPCLRHVEGIETVAFCARDLERARATAAEFRVPDVDTNFSALLRRTEPRLVIITSPPATHAPMAIEALRAGAHVLCEKPTALDAAESGAMLRESEARPGQIALIDHELRLHPGRLRLRAMVESGALGRIHACGVLLHSPSRRDPASPWTWWSDAAQGGGALGAIGSHAVDALRHIVGDEVAAVRGSLAPAHEQRPDPVTGAPRAVTADDVAMALLRFRSGALGSITISLSEAARLHRISVAGATGTACVDEQGPLRVEERGGRPSSEPPDWGLPSASSLGIPDTDWARCFLLLARAIARAIREGGVSPVGAATFADGHANQLVLDAIRRSAGEGRWIPVEPKG